MFRTVESVEDLDFSKVEQSLIPVVVVDKARLLTDGLAGILMVGFANAPAVQVTINTGLATFYSRTRQKQWIKGETSGNRLEVTGLYTDCDRDTLLVTAKPVGPTCHTGASSCFEAPDIGEW